MFIGPEGAEPQASRSHTRGGIGVSLGYPLLDSRGRGSRIGPRNPNFLIVQIAPVSASTLLDSMLAVGDDKLDEVGE